MGFHQGVWGLTRQLTQRWLCSESEPVWSESRDLSGCRMSQAERTISSCSYRVEYLVVALQMGPLAAQGACLLFHLFDSDGASW